MASGRHASVESRWNRFANRNRLMALRMRSAPTFQGGDSGELAVFDLGRRALDQGVFIGTVCRLQQTPMSHSEKLLFTFTSMFGNDYYGEGHDYLFGTNATLVHTQSDQVRVVPQGAKSAAGPGPEDGGFKEFTDRRMRNFFDCVRSRSEPVARSSWAFAPRSLVDWGRHMPWSEVIPAAVLPLRPGDRSRRPRSHRDVAAAPLCGADCTDKQPAAPHPLD